MSICFQPLRYKWGKYANSEMKLQYKIVLLFKVSLFLCEVMLFLFSLFSHETKESLSF